jgi:hypothetical protein
LAQNSGGWKPYDGYNGRSMSQILNKIKAERSEEPERRQESVPERVAVQRPFENMVKDPGPVKMEPLKTLKVIESFNETDTGRRIFLLENGQYVYENGMPVSGQAGSPFKDDNRASINILNLGRELEAMEQRRQLQEQKDRAMEDMRRQADRARSRAKKSWKDDMRDKAIQAQREKQAREKEQAAIEKIMAPITPKPAAAPKKSAAPLAPAGKFNRKIDWKE